MPNAYLELSNLQVGLAAGLILINSAISVALRLGLERRLLIAAVRTVGQLVLVGLVLERVFAWQAWYAVASLALVMTWIAGASAVRRTERRHPGIWIDSITAVWVSSWLISGVALAAASGGGGAWYHPQYAIPVVGMVLGNTLNGVSLGLNRLGDELSSGREKVETLLALGATRWEAARGPIREATRTGMIPMINAMMVVGIVSLPGMMTGQLLAGIRPAEAVKYQIVIMFLIASATALGTVGVVLLSYRRLFNAEHQFLHRRIQHVAEKV